MTRCLIAILACAALARAAALPALLDTAARAAEREINALAGVACTETVVETKLTQKDKTEARRRQTFDYLVLVDSDDGDLAVTESRVEQNPSRKAEAAPLLASNGFATLLLVAHPYYQNSFQFTDLGTEERDGRQWRRLGFQFRPGAHSPSVLRSGAREYPLAWKGEMLLDEAGARVGSVHVTLGSQLEELGIESLEATVTYGPADPANPGEWLPREADIDLRTHHQHWRDVHTFDNYKRFEVTTTEKREVAKQP